MGVSRKILHLSQSTPSHLPQTSLATSHQSEPLSNQLTEGHCSGKVEPSAAKLREGVLVRTTPFHVSLCRYDVSPVWREKLNVLRAPFDSPTLLECYPNE